LIPATWFALPATPQWSARFLLTRCILFTEQEVSRAWRALFREATFNDETFAKAEQLLDELRPESPLRHRLGQELDELRERANQRT
jgi:hypothetical protein